MNLILVFYLLFPAFVANMAPPVAARLKILEKLYYPLDFKKSLFGKRIFGDNKTWLGLLSGVGAAVLVALLQYWLDKLNIVTVDALEGLQQFALFGLLAGLGALLGDAVESFFKRQFKIESGQPFIPFDQIDYLVGYMIFTSFLISWPWTAVIFILACGVVLNPIVNLISYFLKIKKTYW